MLWNATVRKNDTVYILGDFCWGKADEWLRIIRQLNGTKVLIEGNRLQTGQKSAYQPSFPPLSWAPLI